MSQTLSCLPLQSACPPASVVSKENCSSVYRIVTFMFARYHANVPQKNKGIGTTSDIKLKKIGHFYRILCKGTPEDITFMYMLLSFLFKYSKSIWPVSLKYFFTHIVKNKLCLRGKICWLFLKVNTIWFFKNI